MFKSFIMGGYVLCGIRAPANFTCVFFVVLMLMLLFVMFKLFFIFLSIINYFVLVLLPVSPCLLQNVIFILVVILFVGSPFNSFIKAVI